MNPVSPQNIADIGHYSCRFCESLSISKPGIGVLKFLIEPLMEDQRMPI
jgi:hypothetical protein